MLSSPPPPHIGLRFFFRFQANALTLTVKMHEFFVNISRIYVFRKLGISKYGELLVKCAARVTSLFRLFRCVVASF